MKVTLIITTYNWVEALRLSLLSALNQTILPNEIIIADDGSTEDTKKMVEEISTSSKVPIIYSWQEDDGFRLSRSRNLAIAQSQYPYIIIVDGDMILDKDFVGDHLRCASPKRYIQGSRVLLKKDFSNKILESQNFISPSLFSRNINNRFNNLKSSILSKLLCLFDKKEHKGVRGCNFSFFKDDILRVNGFNEDFITWGREDSEFIERLYNSGIQRKNLKFAGIQYHLYHKEGSANSLNNEQLQKTIDERRSWCVNGIDKHLLSKTSQKEIQ